MTVKQLINKLSKMPQNLQVFTADHDHSEYETNSPVNGCYLVDQSEMDYEDVKRHTCNKNEADELYNHPKKYVVVRP